MGDGVPVKACESQRHRKTACLASFFYSAGHEHAGESEWCVQAEHYRQRKSHAESADDIAHDDGADVVPAGKYTGVAEEQAQNQRAEREQDAKEEPLRRPRWDGLRVRAAACPGSPTPTALPVGVVVALMRPMPPTMKRPSSIATIWAAAKAWSL